MPDQRDPWTVALVIVVAVIAVKIGVNNLEWGLKTAAEVVTKRHYRRGTNTDALPCGVVMAIAFFPQQHYVCDRLISHNGAVAHLICLLWN
jgi:hypothetical protein